jgi:hypothetical protein
MLDQETDLQRAGETLADMAETWASAAGLPEALAQMVGQSDAKIRLEAFIKLSWSEGLLSGYQRMSTAQIAAAARAG